MIPDLSTVLLTFSAVIAPVAAHVRPVPRVADEPRLASAAPFQHHDIARSLSSSSHNGPILPRQGGGITEGPCGADLATCAEGYCCSEAGWCGQGTDYCTSPGCQLSYGPACEGNTPPIGNLPSTAKIPRPALGSVPYGAIPGIYSCTVPGTVALTYDDGPSGYTSDLLDTLAAHNAHATFFVVGNNGGRGQISDPAMQWGGLVTRMVAEGHQVASHTWTHENSSVLTAEEMETQLVWNEMAISVGLPGGGFPTYFRPPYSICSEVCQKFTEQLGYHVVYFDLDTDDYDNDDPSLIQNSKAIWDAALEGSDPATDSFLEIGHDIHEQTVYNLTEYMLTSLEAKGFRAVTVGECLGDPAENWYRQSS